MMRTLIVATLLVLAVSSSSADEAIRVTVYGPYFEKNTSGLKGDASYLVIGDRKSFDGYFGSGRVLGKKPDLVPNNAFDKDMLVVAAIKRGDQIHTYKVEKTRLKDGVLQFRYTATGQGGGGAAMYASPLVVAVPRKGIREVEFIENGKKVATVKAEK